MNDDQGTGIWVGSPDRVERVKEMSLRPEEFAAMTGANGGFNPAHPEEWMMFWKQDVCEKDEFHTWFPSMSLVEAQRVWTAMEEYFFGKYDYFLRVWPEWCSSGIWVPPYPGSRAAGGMLDYKYLPLPDDLVTRFQSWQADYDNSPPAARWNWTGPGSTRSVSDSLAI